MSSILYHAFKYACYKCCNSLLSTALVIILCLMPPWAMTGFLWCLYRMMMMTAGGLLMLNRALKIGFWNEWQNCQGPPIMQKDRAHKKGSTWCLSLTFAILVSSLTKPPLLALSAKLSLNSVVDDVIWGPMRVEKTRVIFTALWTGTWKLACVTNRSNFGSFSRMSEISAQRLNLPHVIENVSQQIEEKFNSTQQLSIFFFGFVVPSWGFAKRPTAQLN